VVGFESWLWWVDRKAGFFRPGRKGGFVLLNLGLYAPCEHAKAADQEDLCFHKAGLLKNAE
jgi:hypothetical protein